MTFEEFKTLVTQIIEHDQAGDAYIDSLPGEIQSAFFDNKFVEHLEMVKDLLMKQVFGDLVEWVYWMMWEWKPGYEAKIDDVSYIIGDLDDFFIMMQANYFPE
jgi:hypothetical protein